METKGDAKQTTFNLPVTAHRNNTWRSSLASPEHHSHVDGVASGDLVVLEGLLVVELLALVEEADHGDFHADGLLQVLLYFLDRICRLKRQKHVVPVESLHQKLSEFAEAYLDLDLHYGLVFKINYKQTCD